MANKAAKMNTDIIDVPDELDGNHGCRFCTDESINEIDTNEENYVWELWQCRLCHKYIAKKRHKQLLGKFTHCIVRKKVHNCSDDLGEFESAVVDLVKVSDIKPDYAVDYIGG